MSTPNRHRDPVASDGGQSRRGQLNLAVVKEITDILCTRPDPEMFSEVLAVLLGGLECEFGYFGYIDEAGDLVCPTMTAGIWQQCEIPGKSSVFPREIWGGLWGRSLREKRSLRSNGILDPPQGHVPLRNALVVPLLHHGDVIGQIGLANKSSSFEDSDQVFLEEVARLLSPILHARIERDRLEARREESQRRLRLLSRITEQVSDAVLATDMKFRIIYVNRAFQELYGYRAEEILGKSPDLLNAEPEAARIQEEIGRSVAAGDTWRGELYNRKRGGTVFPCELLVWPLVDEDGTVFAYAGQQRAVTERDRADRERRHLDAQLQKAQKLESLSVLAGGVAHDFKTS